MRIPATLVFFLLIFLSFAQAQGETDVDQLNQKAEALLNQKPKESIVIAGTAKTTAENMGYKKGQAKAVALIGVANYKIDDYSKARIFISQAEALSQQTNDTSSLAFCKYWLANLELNQGQYGKALDYYQHALMLAEKIRDKKNIARALDGKATIYEALGENDKALELYTQSLEVAKEANFKEWYGNVTFELANQDYKNGKLDAALAKYNEALQMSEESGNLNNKASCLQQIASIYYDKNDPKTAMKHVTQAMDIFQETGSMSSFSHSRLLMCLILLSDKQYDLAIDLAKMSLQEGKDKGETDLEKSSAEALYYAYLYKGDKSKALDYHVKFHDLSEANHTKDLAKKMTQLELQASFEKEREIAKAIQDKKEAQAKAEIDKQKLIKKASFMGLGLLAIIAALAVFAFVQKRNDTRLIAAEKKKSDDLLLNILPAEVANELKESGQSKAKNYDMATVLFADIKNFTGAAEKLSPDQLVSEIDYYFKNFDEIVGKYKIEKIKTIGDAYLCVGGLPKADIDNAYYVICAALEMQEFVKRTKEQREKSGGVFFEIRVGIHTGPLIAGIVGLRKFAYDIWGDTVNIAARMEQHGEEGKINISGTTYELVKGKFSCTHRGKIEAKNKGQIDMYFVDGIA
ncbi:MAG TPA: adenylate/guanylate cyclase domain-containing protein [Chitinophagales bacterium]|nr:adenylate/guanylate cyclase domain-containing protein [Chitinophagales bacterium]